MTVPVAEGFRCARASDEVGEDLAGTASTVRAFLLVEAEGAWGSQALRAPLLPEPARAWLGQVEARHRVRPLLVRRSGRRAAAPGPVTVFAACTTPGNQWLVRTTLDGHEDLPGLEAAVSALGRGERPGWAAYDGSLFLTCTHGRHDACCAERGRPVWEAMRRAAPDESWQVSHIGGDRYAANVVVLPEGLYYGRMSPPDATRLVAAHHRGELLLDRLRGRTAWPFAVQAAEVHLRRHTDEPGEGRLLLLGVRRDGELTTARFELGGRSWEVTVRTTTVAPRQLTCSATRPSRSLRHEVVAIR